VINASFLSNKSEKVVINIYDIYGKKMIGEFIGILGIGNNSIPINCETLPNGCYFITLKNSSGIFTLSFSVIK